MMKKLFHIMILSMLLSFSTTIPALAAASTDRAHIERQTVFNNTTDYFAAIGKSKKKKITIKRARWLARRKARLRKIREQNKKKNRRR